VKPPIRAIVTKKVTKPATTTNRAKTREVVKRSKPAPAERSKSLARRLTNKLREHHAQSVTMQTPPSEAELEPVVPETPELRQGLIDRGDGADQSVSQSVESVPSNHSITTSPGVSNDISKQDAESSDETLSEIDDDELPAMERIYARELSTFGSAFGPPLHDDRDRAVASSISSPSPVIADSKPPTPHEGSSGKGETSSVIPPAPKEVIKYEAPNERRNGIQHPPSCREVASRGPVAGASIQHLPEHSLTAVGVSEQAVGQPLDLKDSPLSPSTQLDASESDLHQRQSGRKRKVPKQFGEYRLLEEVVPLDLTVIPEGAVQDDEDFTPPGGKKRRTSNTKRQAVQEPRPASTSIAKKIVTCKVLATPQRLEAGGCNQEGATDPEGQSTTQVKNGTKQTHTIYAVKACCSSHINCER